MKKVLTSGILSGILIKLFSRGRNPPGENEKNQINLKKVLDRLKEMC